MPTRRSFIKNGLVIIAGAAGAAGATAAALPAGAAFPETPGKARYAMIVNPNRCMGCDACMAACALQNKTASEYFLTSVLESETGAYPASRPVFMPIACNQCENPPCLPACPHKAISKLKNGVVVTDWNLCAGDGSCIAACPFGARFMDPRFQKADKCDFCLDRLAAGLEPACVECCPSGARTFGNIDAPEGLFAEALKLAGLAPRMPELGLKTSVLYVPDDHATTSAANANSRETV